MTGRTLDLLIVSDLWPPHFVGGYELGAARIAARLAARGHRITVLTSSYGVDEPCSDDGVQRVLFEQVHFSALGPRRLIRDTIESTRRRKALPKVLDELCFDLVYLFNPLGLRANVVLDLCRTGRPVVAYVSDHWVGQWPQADRLLAHWLTPRWYLSPLAEIGFVLLRQLFRRLGHLDFTPAELPIRHAQFVSRFIQHLSRPRLPALATEEVIPWGIDVARLPYRPRRSEELSEWAYVGQLEEHKGPHVAIEAVRRLREAGERVRLTLYGTGGGFAANLQQQVRSAGLSERVHFAGQVPPERLWGEVNARAGLLIFPTLWDEPFSITLLEAFASGVPVVCTLTGGTGEIVRDGETATVVRSGDADDLVRVFRALRARPEHALAMAERARDVVEAHLDIEHMVDRVERHLLEVAEGRGSHGVEPAEPALHPWEIEDQPAQSEARSA